MSAACVSLFIPQCLAEEGGQRSLGLAAVRRARAFERGAGVFVDPTRIATPLLPVGGGGYGLFLQTGGRACGAVGEPAQDFCLLLVEGCVQQA